MVACPDCGHENADGAKFCSECGANLLAPTPRRREMRKTVTVVFCDVTESTALGERLDPESLRGVMTRYFERMQGVLEAHGGTVEKFIAASSKRRCERIESRPWGSDRGCAPRCDG